MKRANIIAKGKVQKVGYRDFVQDSARELGITGDVENLEDGNVKIVCEGEEPKIERFIRDIKVKKDFIDVRETLVKYEEPTGEFKVFKIKYGDVPEELGDRLGAALLYQGATNQKIDVTNQKIDAGFKMLGGKIDEGREENKQGFGMLAGKIDEGREENKQGFGMLAGKIDEGREENKQGFGMLAGKIDEGREENKQGFGMLAGKIDEGREENKQGFGMLAGKIDEGREENKQGFGMLAGKMDMMLGKQEDTIEAIDRNKDEIVTEISSLREDLRSYMENKFAKIEYEIEGIKAKIGMV